MNMNPQLGNTQYPMRPRILCITHMHLNVQMSTEIAPITYHLLCTLPLILLITLTLKHITHKPIHAHADRLRKAAACLPECNILEPVYRPACCTQTERHFHTLKTKRVCSTPRMIMTLFNCLLCQCPPSTPQPPGNAVLWVYVNAVKAK